MRAEPDPSVGVVIPAAGAARRMGGKKKPFLRLAGEPVLLRAMRPFLSHAGVRTLAVALPSEAARQPPSWLTDLGPHVRVVEGGQTRRDSVWAGLSALPAGLDVIVVHDGVRPLVSPQVVGRCIAVAARGAAAVAGYPAVDTLKRVDASGNVTGTPDRASYWHAQTPQAFPGVQLREAYRRAVAQDWPATDDAALVERSGGEVVMVRSSPTNLKITRPEDLETARSVLAGRAP